MAVPRLLSDDFHVKLCRQLGVHADEYAGRQLRVVSDGLLHYVLDQLTEAAISPDLRQQTGKAICGASFPDGVCPIATCECCSDEAAAAITTVMSYLVRKAASPCPTKP